MTPETNAIDCASTSYSTPAPQLSSYVFHRPARASGKTKPSPLVDASVGKATLSCKTPGETEPRFSRKQPDRAMSRAQRPLQDIVDVSDALCQTAQRPNLGSNQRPFQVSAGQTIDAASTANTHSPGVTTTSTGESSASAKPSDKGKTGPTRDAKGRSLSDVLKEHNFDFAGRYISSKGKVLSVDIDELSDAVKSIICDAVQDLTKHGVDWEEQDFSKAAYAWSSHESKDVQVAYRSGTRCCVPNLH